MNNLTFSHFEKMHNSGYTLDYVYLLTLIESGDDVKELCESPRMRALYQGLYRKGLITDKGKITMTGKELMSYTTDGVVMDKKAKKVQAIANFDAWWKAYPGTDTFVHKGKTFTGTRSLRTKKDDCKAKFDKILEEGEYTVEDMIAALEYEVLQKKENSIKHKTNKLTFMQNSLTYLNQRTFEPFIELVKEGVKIKEQEEVQGGTDI